MADNHKRVIFVLRIIWNYGCIDFSDFVIKRGSELQKCVRIARRDLECERNN